MASNKKRRGYKKIVVDDVEYQYAISLSTAQIFVYQGKKRYQWQLSIAPQAPRKYSSWRGKHGDGPYGRREVAIIIREKLRKPDADKDN